MPERAQLDAAKINEIRSSHLELGRDKTEYPEAKEAPKKIENQLSAQLLQDLRKEHFATGF